MKRKMIEALAPPKTRKNGKIIIVQQLSDILILNIFADKDLKTRHCVNAATGEYETYKKGKWCRKNIERSFDYPEYDILWGGAYRKLGEMKGITREDKEKITESILKYWPQKKYYAERPLQLISQIEAENGRERRRKARESHLKKVETEMDLVPEIPKGLKNWLDQVATGGLHYILKNKKTQKWTCSACGGLSEEKEIKTAAGQKPRNNDMVICPRCGKEVKIRKRKQEIAEYPRFALVQNIDEKRSVIRHFESEIYWGSSGEKKSILAWELIRIIMHKRDNREIRNLCMDRSQACTIYYQQTWDSVAIVEGEKNHSGYYDIHNPRNRRMGDGYLYDDGIEEAFRGTSYEVWTRIFTLMSKDGMKADYNAMMATKRAVDMSAVAELLYKGRFFRLLQEEMSSINVSLYEGHYYGQLDLTAMDINGVFRIEDRQLINRIRDRDGGRLMLDWMRWSELNCRKISDKVLDWIIENNIQVDEFGGWLQCRFTLEKAMNYIERQRRESYKRHSVKAVMNQYEDYMKMCEKLKKDTTDEMVYRPRDLKKRHDEAVLEIEKMQAEIKADEYSRRYPAAEKVLQAVKTRLDYTGEAYMIITPRRIVEIVQEGRALHHCAGATDRYFDRIASHETYICFCRKVEDPEKPFYTIEVEPGGTIRQHRGMYDEEPELETVKPFLREWQQEIRRRMKEEDHERAARSKILREENIRELKEKNNTRVLKGLMEDLMEVV